MSARPLILCSDCRAVIPVALTKLMRDDCGYVLFGCCPCGMSTSSVHSFRDGILSSPSHPPVTAATDAAVWATVAPLPGAAI